MTTLYQHTPVLRDEAVRQLVVSPAGVYVDATCGLGGHSEKICEQLGPQGRLFCFDLDPRALEIANARLIRFTNVHFIQNNFDKMKVELHAAGVRHIDGVLYDLGVSSMEIDAPERGFSFMQDGPLDMRMQHDGTTAADLVNTSSRESLEAIIREYGEERFSGRIARSIVETRPHIRTGSLADAVRRVVHGPHVNKSLARVFQALRIAVNHELESLKTSLDTAITLLNPGGRLVVIAYHSLEDRIVKHRIREAASDCICPPEAPVCVCGHRAEMKIINKKPLTPSDEEIAKNPRSRSARCRVAEKL